MKDWKNSLLWASYPPLILLVVFGFIAALNWDYESKLIFLDKRGPDEDAMYMGPILLATAMGLAFVASFLLLVIRFFWPKSHTTWFMFPLTCITILLIFPGLFIIILGPATITMMEQSRAVSK